MEDKFEKTTEEKVGIAVEVVNLLSAKKCTVDEAYEILNSAKWTIEHTSTVQKFEWKANPKGGEGMLRDLLKRARAGENVLDEVLKEVLPNQSEEIKKAIANKVPILLLDNVGDGTDPLLYHALKNAGALQVPNYHIMRENGGMKSNCVYLTIFVNEKAKEDLHYC